MATIKLGNLYHESTTEPNSVTNPVNVKDINSASMKSRLDLLATESKLEQVRVLLAGVATEAKLEQARVLLNTISTKDFATQTTLAAVLAKLGQLETEIQAVKTNQLSGDQKVTLSGTIMEHYGATVAQRPEATEVPVGAAYMAVNTGDVWQSNGFEWVVL